MCSHNLFTERNEKNKVVLSKDLFTWYSDNHQDKAVIIWDENEKIIHASKAFATIITMKSEELIGRQWTTLFSQNIQHKIQEHFSESTVKLTASAIHIGVDDTQVIEGDIIIDCMQMDGKLIYICQLESKMYINQLEEIIADTQKAIVSAQLAAGLVHEIRNPLTSIKGFIQLIQAGVQQKENFYQVIINEIDHLEKITTELLQIAKPFNGEMKEEFVHELIQDISLVMNIQSNFDHITLDIVSEDDLLVTCNAPQIKQILINLLLNAMEAMEDQGVITLHAYRQKDYVIIDIIDEGEGVTHDIIKELDQPFFTTKEKGTGLGLSITKHLLDLHNAKLEVKKNKNKGSTFTVKLPNSNVE